MIKGSIHLEDIIIINVYDLITGLKIIKQILRHLTAEIHTRNWRF